MIHAMLNKIYLLILFIAICSFSFIKVTATSVFTGTVSNEWNHPMNWQPQIVPGINDDVIIPSSFSGILTISNANASCRNLHTIGSQLMIVINPGWRLIIGGDLLLQGNSTIMGSGVLEFNGSSLSSIILNGNSTLQVGLIEINKQGQLNLNSNFNVSNSTIRIISGTFNCMGYSINAFSIQMAESNFPKSFHCVGSQIELNRIILYLNQNSTFLSFQSTFIVHEYIYQNGTTQFYNIRFKPNAEYILDGMMANTYANIIQAEGDISLIGSKQNTAKRFHIQVLDMLNDNAICNMTESPFVEYYKINSFQFSNSCTSNYLFSDFNEVNASQVRIMLDGNINLSRVSFANVRALNGSIFVTGGVDLGNNTNIQFSSQPIQTLYWVGGQGNWHDGNHWSYVSGGAPAGCIPDLNTNAVIDDMSGFSSNDSILVLNNLFVRNLMFYSSNIKPVFSSNSNGNLFIRGSLSLNGLSELNQNAPTYFYGDDYHLLITNNLKFDENLFFLSSGTWNVEGNLNLADGNKSILHLNGKIITHGNPVFVSSYISNPVKIPYTHREFDIQNSVIYIGNAHQTPGFLFINSTNYTIHSNGSSIVYNHQLNQTPVFEILGGNDLEFDQLKFNHPLVEAQVKLNQKCSFKKIECNADVKFSGLPSNLTNISTRADSLILFGGFKMSVVSSTTLTINQGIAVRSNPCKSLAYLTSTHPLIRSGIHLTTALSSSVKFLVCKSIEFTGNNPIYIEEGVDHLNNSGAVFLQAANERIFYWNGEAGDGLWNNCINWNVNFEPHAGYGNDLNVLYNANGCLPGFIDSVVFHINSFPLNDSVIVNGNFNFKGMNWMQGTGVNRVFTGSPIYTLNNYGGLRLDNGLLASFNGIYKFNAYENRTIQSNNVVLFCKIQFLGFGSYALFDGINAPHSNVEIYSGSFYTNNHPIVAKNLIVDLIPMTGLNFKFQSDSSVFTVMQNALFGFMEGFHQVLTEHTQMNMIGPAAVFTLKGNKVNLLFKQIKFSSTIGTATYNSLYYTSPPKISFVEFASNGRIMGNNIFDSLQFSEGRIYEFEYNTLQSILYHLNSKGSPCFRTTIQSTRPGFRAKISQPNCLLSIDHARLRDIEAVDNLCSTLNYKVNIGSENLGNNLNWIFIPGDPINGLGVDTIIGCKELPFEVTTNGFGPFISLVWDNGFTGYPYQVIHSDTLTVIVTYSPSCVVYDTRNIFVENSISHTYSLDSVSCYGMNDGSIEYHVIGGNGSYTSFWNSSNNYTTLNDSTLTNLSSGLYQHIVYQIGFENVCYDTLSVFVYQPDSLMIHASVNHISCYGLQDGQIQLQITGGNGGYNIHWSHDASIQSNSINQLAEGNYIVSVVDSKNCQADYIIAITKPDSIQVHFSTQPTVCGLSQGSAIFTVQGGTTPFQYFWFHNSTLHNSQAFDLPPGLNAFYYLDANLCSDTIFFTIDQVNKISAEYLINDVSCYGFQDGEIFIYPTGGNGIFNYSLDNYLFSDQAFFSQLAYGNHIVQVVDSNGCVFIDSVYIDQPEPISIQQIDLIQPRCYGDSNGMISIISTGGIGMHAFQWYGFTNPSAVLSSIPAGNYTLTITDENGCNENFQFYLTQPDSLSLITKSIEHVSCYGENDGLIVLDAIGGTPEYSFHFADYTLTSNVVTNLYSGNYSFLVFDQHGCEASIDVEIDQPLPINIRLDTVIPGKCNVPEGIIEISVTGGSYPFTYLWNNDVHEEDNSFALNGENTVIVTDMNGCKEKLEVNITCINQIFVPQLITPNGDGIGDIWLIHDLYRLFPNNHVQIFNRWGNLVFNYKGYSDQFKGLSNQSTTIGDGLLPESTYYYVIDLGENWGTLTGFLELDY